MTWRSKKLVVALPVVAVAVIAGVVSYGHIETLALAHHQSLAQARLLPFAVDFLIVAGSALLLDGYWLGWLGVATGVAGTLFANVESGLPYGSLAATVAAWPAVAFTVASFMLERWLRRQAQSHKKEPREAMLRPAFVAAAEPSSPGWLGGGGEASSPGPTVHTGGPGITSTFTAGQESFAAEPELSLEEQARAAYLASVEAGEPLTDRRLGMQFSKSRTWAASRIKETQTA